MKASSVLSEDTPSITLRASQPEFEIWMRNAPKDESGHAPHIIASVIGKEIALQAVAESFGAILASTLDILTFATHTIFKIEQYIMVLDWEPFEKERNARYMKKFPMFDPPGPDLNADWANTARAVIEAKPSAHVERALQWFRYGVIGEQPEEQFQYFWLAIETIAEGMKSKKAVPIPCAECGAALECNECHNVPTRVPMAQQAIRGYVSKIVGNQKSSEVYRILSASRNHLLHGGSRDSLKGKVGVSADTIINTAAFIAWHMIYGSLSLCEPLLFFERGGDFVNKNLIFGANIRFTHTGSEEQPTKDKIPQPELSITTSFRKTVEDQA